METLGPWGHGFWETSQSAAMAVLVRISGSRPGRLCGSGVRATTLRERFEQALSGNA